MATAHKSRVLDMTQGDPFRLVLQFSMPLFCSNLLQQLYNLTDTALAGHLLGSAALAEIGATAALYGLIMNFAFGMNNGLALTVSRLFGAGDEKGVRRATAWMLALAGETEDEEGEFFRAGPAYAMSKKIVIYFTQKNVARFAEKHCRILSISPGCYLTPMLQKLIDNQPETAENQLELIPAGRWGHPYEMGALTAFLCSSGAGYINGVDILADGGQNAGIFVPQI